jgi:hypothetical protein
MLIMLLYYYYVIITLGTELQLIVRLAYAECRGHK